jgi:hypothetical protein
MAHHRRSKLVAQLQTYYRPAAPSAPRQRAGTVSEELLDDKVVRLLRTAAESFVLPDRSWRLIRIIVSAMIAASTRMPTEIR